MTRLMIGSSDKTNLLLHFAAQDFERGLLLIDPTGSVAEAAINAIPKRLIQNVFYLDPADIERPFGWNILGNIPPDQRHTHTENICADFDALFPEGETTLARANANLLLANSLRVLLDTPNTTLLSLLKLLSDQSYRSECLNNCTDPVVLANWDTIRGWERAQYQAALATLQSKVGKLLMSPTLRNIFGQQFSTFSLSAPKIVIAKLDRAKLGDLTTYLLGSLLIARSVNHTYVHQLGFFSSDHLAAHITRGNFTVTVDFLDQLTPKLRQTVLQFDQKYVFKTNRDDAQELAFYVGSENPSQLVDLADDEYKELGESPQVPPKPAYRPQLRAIRKRSRRSHTRPRAMVEEHIRKALGG